MHFQSETFLIRLLLSDCCLLKCFCIIIVGIKSDIHLGGKMKQNFSSEKKEPLNASIYEIYICIRELTA